MTKLAAERRHAKRRAAERYGLTLNRVALREIGNLIQNRKAEFVDRQSCRISRWRITWQDVTATVVWDSKRHCVVTFLPPTPGGDSHGHA